MPDPKPETPELLDRLLRIPAPSGYEEPAALAWRKEAAFARVSSDALGSSIATIGEEQAGPLVAVVGHIDEIGLVVRHIDEKGFLHFGPIGGWDPQILIGQRVVVEGRSGQVRGVAGRKPIHLLDPDQRKKVVELKEMHLDIGAADRETAEAMVSLIQRRDCCCILLSGAWSTRPSRSRGNASGLRQLTSQRLRGRSDRNCCACANLPTASRPQTLPSASLASVG